MKRIRYVFIVSTMLLGCLRPAQAEHPYRTSHMGLSLHGGTFSLEGPAVTTLADGGEQDVDMMGGRVEGHVVLGGPWYSRAVLDASRLDDEAGLVLATLAVGAIRPLVEGGSWRLDGFAHGGLEYARSSGLGDYPSDPAFDGTGSGRSGDDVGASLEAGVSVAFREATRADLFAKYITFGGGDGPSFGLRVGHDLSERWTLTGAWDGIWVEDDGIQIDQAFRRFSLGVLRRF